MEINFLSFYECTAMYRVRYIAFADDYSPFEQTSAFQIDRPSVRPRSSSFKPLPPIDRDPQRNPLGI